MLKGVSNVEAGYAGGSTRSTSSGQVAPTYEDVSRGSTGHAEVIRVTYDPAVISYEDLLTVFFGSHDPTTTNRQGADVGEQYRSVIFYRGDEEKRLAESKVKEVNESLKDSTRIVTQLVPLESFYMAEDYHQQYYEKNKSAPYCMLVVEPKIEKVRKRFAELLNDDATK